MAPDGKLWVRLEQGDRRVVVEDARKAAEALAFASGLLAGKLEELARCHAAAVAANADYHRVQREVVQLRDDVAEADRNLRGALGQ